MKTGCSEELGIIEKIKEKIDKKENVEVEMRLNKFIADAGVCSRRKADEMIKEGRVTVNKHEAVIGMEVSPEDVVKVDGERVKLIQTMNITC